MFPRQSLRLRQSASTESHDGGTWLPSRRRRFGTNRAHTAVPAQHTLHLHGMGALAVATGPEQCVLVPLMENNWPKAIWTSVRVEGDEAHGANGLSSVNRNVTMVLRCLS